MTYGDLIRQSSNKKIAVFIAALTTNMLGEEDTFSEIYKERVKTCEEFLNMEVEVKE